MLKYTTINESPALGSDFAYVLNGLVETPPVYDTARADRVVRGYYVVPVSEDDAAEIARHGYHDAAAARWAVVPFADTAQTHPEFFLTATADDATALADDLALDLLEE